MSSSERPVVLVTGARTGIGRHLAEHLLAKGWLVVGCSRSPSDLSVPGYEHILADVTDETAVSELIRQIRRGHGRLDAVVNNAGIASMNPALLTPLASARRVLETNFLGSFLVAREGARLMIRRRQGRIINISTVAVPWALEGESLYAASKGAVETFTRVFAREVAGYGITVNAIGPSPVETDLIRGIPRSQLNRLLDRLAIRRFGTGADIANVVDFFLCPESSYVTGQILYLGGP